MNKDRSTWVKGLRVEGFRARVLGFRAFGVWDFGGLRILGFRVLKV